MNEERCPDCKGTARNPNTYCPHPVHGTPEAESLWTRYAPAPTKAGEEKYYEDVVRECPVCMGRGYRIIASNQAEPTTTKGGHSCPVCAEARLQAENAALRAEIERQEEKTIAAEGPGITWRDVVPAFDYTGEVVAKKIEAAEAEVERLIEALKQIRKNTDSPTIHLIADRAIRLTEAPEDVEG